MRNSAYTPGTNALIERVRSARNLLEWWNATNPAEEENTRLAIDTRKWLAHLTVDVPKLNDNARAYALGDETPSQTPQLPGRNDTTVPVTVYDVGAPLSQDKDAQDGGADAENKGTDSIPRIGSDRFVQHGRHK